MKPLDPRLFRHAHAARGYVLLTAGLGILTAGLVVAQAILIAAIAAPAITSARPLREATGLLVALAAVIGARALAVGIQERYAHRAATRVIIDLRTQVLEKAIALGPRWTASGRGPATVTLVTRGLDDLGPYFVRYLPQLLLAATLTPATLAVVGVLEWVSAAIIIVTIPLVPFFMILVGQLTQGVSDRRLGTMQRLSSQVLDLVAGIPTLRAFGREIGPGRRVRELGEAHRRATMGTLRVAFLSGMVLELLTTLSVALVAVSIGLRMVDGKLDLFTGLAVLIMAPEVYLPLRQVGLHFHASTDGIAAADAVFEVLEETPAQVPALSNGSAAFDGAESTVPTAWSELRINGLGIRAPGRDVIAPAALTASILPGRITALAGGNGAGKSTTVLALLGLLTPDEGSIELVDHDGVASDLSSVDQTLWHSQISWVPQRSALRPGPIRAAVLDIEATPELSGAPVPALDAATTARLDAAARMTGLDAVLADLPDGWETLIGQGGYGLSLGQRQRIALTRALVSDRHIVILDEPTAHLDSDLEQQIHATLSHLRAEGRTVIIVAHRRGLLEIADDIINVSCAPLTTDSLTEVTA